MNNPLKAFHLATSAPIGLPEQRPELLGASVKVPLVSGQWRQYVNLDYAASTPPLLAVMRNLEAFLPYYSSVHRGAGYKSQISTAAYEGARETVKAFFRARRDDAVIFTRNTTDAINLLASSLPEGSSVVSFASEHHANFLPWQLVPGRVTYLDAPSSAIDSLDRLEEHFTSGAPTTLVAVTGASNVTGEIWPLAEIAALAHSHGARLLLDAAQLAPHFKVDVTDLDVDYMAVSGHKLYAPFGAGVLIGRADWLEATDPFLRGGGAVDFVTTSEVLWSALPERQEAGSPNVVGAVAMAVALEQLAKYGMDRIGQEEIALGNYARSRLCSVPGLDLYRLWDEQAARIGVATFNLAGYDHSQVAAILSAEFGIGVRHGCFCAHPLMLQLLGVSDDQASRIRAGMKRGEKSRIPGAVRMSLGLGTRQSEIDYLVASLEQLATEGPRWHYAVDPQTGDYLPDPDPRPWPDLPISLARDRRSYAESS
jgi:selenocysteine lyase/cysteine desulfurase